MLCTSVPLSVNNVQHCVHSVAHNLLCITYEFIVRCGTRSDLYKHLCHTDDDKGKGNHVDEEGKNSSYFPQRHCHINRR